MVKQRQLTSIQTKYLSFTCQMVYHLVTPSSLFQNADIFLIFSCLQVQELVSAELFSRYDTVLLSALLDTMEDMLYCPRPACQYPVVLEPGEKMATCPSCTYAFCIYCKMVYHGIEPCRFRSCEYSCHKFMMRVFPYVFFQFYSLFFTTAIWSYISS